MSDTDGLFFRSASEVHSEGRTLVGIAFPWEVAALVSDYGGPKYLEDFARSSADETLRRNPEPRPLFANHGHVYGDVPIGVASFMRGEQGLMYRSFLSRTQAADEALELAKDGALTDVSVGYNVPKGKTKFLRTTEGVVSRRMEIMLAEMSLAPTGMGQHGGRVLAIRSDVTFSEVQDAVGDAIEKTLYGADGPPDDVYVWLKDITDTYAVYQIEGGELDEARTGYWSVDYERAADGTVSLGEPVHGDYTFSPDVVVRSSILHPSPRLDAWRRRRALMYRP